MKNYFFWVDAFTTFWSSSDLVKIVWLRAPAICAVTLIHIFLKLYVRTSTLPKYPVLSLILLTTGLSQSINLRQALS